MDGITFAGKKACEPSSDAAGPADNADFKSVHLLNLIELVKK